MMDVMNRKSYEVQQEVQDEVQLSSQLHEQLHKQLLQRLQGSLQRVLIGKEGLITQVLTAALAGGHILLEDVPGVGKTLLARALARVLGGDFARVQFTPDLQPADVTGGMVWHAARAEFVYREGPLMRHIVLADELNRTLPSTQAALLEAMEEGAVSVDGVTHRLPEPFLLLATQNPLQDVGTYPLPEAQLDRFMMRLSIGYPSPADEVRLLGGEGGVEALARLRPVLLPTEWRALQLRANEVLVEQSLLAYAVELARHTRESGRALLGISPRGVRDWVKAARAFALLEERGYVLPDDFKATALPVLAHRLVLHDGAQSESYIKELLEQLPLPVGGGRSGRSGYWPGRKLGSKVISRAGKL